MIISPKKSVAMQITFIYLATDVGIFVSVFYIWWN